MTDFDLPPQTMVNKHIPKDAFYKNANVSTKLKHDFVQQIQKIIWRHKLAPTTLGINATDAVEEMQIFELQLKENILPKKVIQLIDKAIPYQILYLCRYQDNTAYAISYVHEGRRLHYWTPRNPAVSFRFDGYTLEDVYQGCIKVFLGYTDQSGSDEDKSKTLDDMVGIDQQKKKLTREIQRLQNKIKK